MKKILVMIMVLGLLSVMGVDATEFHYDMQSGNITEDGVVMGNFKEAFSPTSDLIRSKIVSCEPNILVNTWLTEMPGTGLQNENKVLYRFWDEWSLKWFIKNREFQTLSYCEGNITVYDDLGKRTKLTHKWFEEQLLTPEFMKGALLLPEMRCKVSYCGESGWSKMKTYKYKRPYDTGETRSCWFGLAQCPIMDWVEEEHTWEEWVDIYGVGDYEPPITENNVSECISNDCLGLYS